MRRFATDSPAGAEGEERSDLELRIVRFPLPWKRLLRPGNLLFLLGGSAAALRICLELPFRKVEKLFPPAGKRPRRANEEKAAIALSLTERLLRSPFFPFRRTCLRRSIVLAHLLRKSGVEVQIAFGVDPREGSFRGHSWLLREGRPFLEKDEEWRRHTAVFHIPIERC